MDKRKAIAEIERICNEAGLKFIIFDNEKAMVEMLDDMRRGANVRHGLKLAGLPVEKEYLM